jgi:rRNA maturation endonuclease Nob1
MSAQPKEDKTKPWLVIDANVLIKHANLQELLVKYNLCTVQSVITEVRDPNARTRLMTIIDRLRIEAPDKTSCNQGRMKSN